MNLSFRQEQIVVRIAAAILVLLALAGMVLVARGRDDGCLDGGFALPTPEQFYTYVITMLENPPQVQAATGWWEYSEDHEVMLHVEFVDGSVAHIFFEALCTNDTGDIYPQVRIEAVE